MIADYAAGNLQQEFTINECTRYVNGGTVILCQEASARFPLGTIVQFRLDGISNVAFTTLKTPYDPATDESLVTLTATSGCIENGGLALVNSAGNKADVSTVLQCNVPDAGETKVRIAQPYPAVTFPLGSVAVFFPPSTCPVTEESSCFTKAGSVQIEGLSKQIPLARLRSANRVLDGAEYTNVLGFLHELHAAGEVVCIEHEGGELRISPLHLVFSRSGEKESKNVEIGDELLVSPGRFSRVLATRRDETDGFLAPLTASGSIMVDGAIVSNYASVRNLPLSHSSMHAAFFLARAAAMLFGTRVADEATMQNGADVQHPLVDLYVRVLKLDDVLKFLQ